MLDYLVMHYKASPQTKTELGTVSEFRRQFDGYEIAIHIHKTGWSSFTTVAIYIDDNDNDSRYIQPNLNFCLKEISIPNLEAQVEKIVPILQAIKIKI